MIDIQGWFDSLTWMGTGQFVFVLMWITVMFRWQNKSRMRLVFTGFFAAFYFLGQYCLDHPGYFSKSKESVQGAILILSLIVLGLGSFGMFMGSLVEPDFKKKSND